MGCPLGATKNGRPGSFFNPSGRLISLLLKNKKLLGGKRRPEANKLIWGGRGPTHTPKKPLMQKSLCVMGSLVCFLPSRFFGVCVCVCVCPCFETLCVCVCSACLCGSPPSPRRPCPPTHGCMHVFVSPAQQNGLQVRELMGA